MRKRLYSKNEIIGAAVLVLLTMSIFVVARFKIGFHWRDLLGEVKRMRWQYLALGALCTLGYIFCESRAFVCAIRPLGIKLKPGRALIYACIELYFAGITPSATGGQPALAYYMSKDKIKLSKSSGMLLANTLHYTVSLVLLSVFALSFRPGLVLNANTPFRVFFWVGFSINLVLLALCCLLMARPGLVRRPVRAGIRLFSRLHLLRRRDERLEAFDASLADYAGCLAVMKRSPFAQFKMLLWNILQRISFFSVAFAVYAALGCRGHGFVDLLCIQIIAAVAVNSLPLPGSVGAAEGAFVWLYGGIYAKGIQLTSAMLVTRGISFYLCLFVSAAVTIIYHFSIIKRKSGEITQ